jgi:excinuclease ABC subunit C
VQSGLTAGYRQGEPCLNYYIGRCIGPCRGDVPAAAYRAVMESICQFFEGKYRPILDDLRRRMDQAAAELKFEEASLWRDRIRALEKLMERQQAVSTRDEDRDVIGMPAMQRKLRAETGDPRRPDRFGGLVLLPRRRG